MIKFVVLALFIAFALAYPAPDTDTGSQNALPEGEKADDIEGRFGGHGGHRRFGGHGGHYPQGGHYGGHYPQGQYGGHYPQGGHYGGHYPQGGHHGGYYPQGGHGGYPGGIYG